MAAGEVAALSKEAPATLDEEFLEMLLASERVGELLDSIKEHHSLQKWALKKRRQAVLDLAAAVEAKESYAVEARLAGAVDLVTALLKSTTEDEELMQSASSIITACSGSMSCGGKVQLFTFGEGLSVHIRECSLADGLGARVWAIAHCLARELVVTPSLVRGRSVLEIGAGVGLCGLLAAKLGASEVVLTDYEDKVLRNLRECMAMNAAEVNHLSHNGNHACGVGGPEEALEGDEDEDDMFGDPEDAEECDDFDFFSGAAGAGRQPPGSQQPWDYGKVCVRYMDWNDELHRLHRAASQPGAAAGGGKGASDREDGAAPAALDAHATFDVVLGSDILYEMEHAEMVAAVLKLRLRPGGLTLIGLAVRDYAILDDFVGRVEDMGMSIQRRQVEPCLETRTVLGNDRDYEGGFVLLTVSAASHNAR